MNPYFEQQILTAGPMELVRMVYRRAITSVREAREHLRHGRIAERSRAISMAYVALQELSSSLRPEAAPELAARLGQLYCYMQQRLLDANFQKADAPLTEVLGLLTTLADAWNQIQYPTDEAEPEVRPGDWPHGEWTMKTPAESGVTIEA